MTGTVASSDISFVVQGNVDRKCVEGVGITERVLRSIREHYPGAEIVLSTWEGTKVDRLDFDTIVFSKDPGPTETHSKPLNVNRQIISSYNGILAAERPWVLKTRSDLEFYRPGYFDYLNKFVQFDERWKFFDTKVTVTTATSKDPRLWYHMPFHICDWTWGGKREDVEQVFDCEPYPQEFIGYHWLKQVPKPFGFSRAMMDRRYYAESYLWFSLLSKHYDFEFQHAFDISDDLIAIHEKILVSNLVMLDASDLGFHSLKVAIPPGFNRFTAYRSSGFIRLYNQNTKSTVPNPKYFRDEMVRYAYYLRERLRPVWRYFIKFLKRRCSTT
jgi:hypothetical protein